MFIIFQSVVLHKVANRQTNKQTKQTPEQVVEYGVTMEVKCTSTVTSRLSWVYRHSLRK